MCVFCAGVFVFAMPANGAVFNPSGFAGTAGVTRTGAFGADGRELLGIYFVFGVAPSNGISCAAGMSGLARCRIASACL